MYDIKMYDENGFECFYAPEEDICPFFTESDNPVCNSQENADLAAICAESVFGIKSLYPWQRLAVANILDAVSASDKAEASGRRHKPLSDKNGNSEKLTELYDEDGILRGRQIILLPTGAGKSLCFQLPALLIEQPTLIIYPLLALMNDQFRRMKETALSPAIFRGGQSKAEREAQFARLEGTDGEFPAKLIIANPEILADKDILERIKIRKPAHIAIDEAHCVSEWGDSFRPAYLELARIIRELKPAAVTAFTATASEDVLKRVSEILFDGRAHLVKGESGRPNILYSVRRCAVKEPFLLSEVKKHKKPLVIFCSSRIKTEKTARFLRYALNTDDIKFYHAGLEREEKNNVENWFHKSRSGILVSTCAWGMGVDKKDVKTVIHLDPPSSAEAYIQEAGRAGRDGSTVNAILLWSFEDAKRIEKLPAEKRKRASVLLDFAESGKCRREVLQQAMDGNMRKNSLQKNACSGCDICKGTALMFAEDEAELVNFLRKNKNIFNKNELIEKLKKENPLWRVSDLAALIMQLTDSKKITEGKFLWKGKLSAGIRIQKSTQIHKTAFQPACFQIKL